MDRNTRLRVIEEILSILGPDFGYFREVDGADFSEETSRLLQFRYLGEYSIKKKEILTAKAEELRKCCIYDVEFYTCGGIGSWIQVYIHGLEELIEEKSKLENKLLEINGKIETYYHQILKL
jgi:hypothetical protein